MKSEADHLGVFRRSERDGCLGGEMMRGGVDLGVDDVASDFECGAFGPLRCQGTGREKSDAKNQERRQRAKSAQLQRPADKRFQVQHFQCQTHVLPNRDEALYCHFRRPHPQDCADSATVRALPICLIVMPATRLMAVSTSSPNPESPGVRRLRKRASSFIMDWRSGPSGSRGSIWRTILAAVKSA